MTRQELIEMVENRLVHNTPGVDTTEMFSQPMISKHLELTYEYVLNQIISKNKIQTGLAELNSYAKTYYGIEVKEDSDREQKYVNLPVKPVKLMRNEAIRLVSSNKSVKDAFFIRQGGAQRYMMSTLDVDKMHTGKCYVEGDRIYFDHIDPDLEKVQISMIPSFDNYALDDEIILPLEGESMVVENTVQMLLNKYNLPPDNVNDQTKM